jgi:hypothetical protein
MAAEIRRRTILYLKVEMEHGVEEKPARFGEDLSRHLMRLYGVRSAELENYISEESPEG